MFDPIKFKNETAKRVLQEMEDNFKNDRRLLSDYYVENDSVSLQDLMDIVVYDDELVNSYNGNFYLDRESAINDLNDIMWTDLFKKAVNDINIDKKPFIEVLSDPVEIDLMVRSELFFDSVLDAAKEFVKNHGLTLVDTDVYQLVDLVEA